MEIYVGFGAMFIVLLIIIAIYKFTKDLLKEFMGKYQRPNFRAHVNFLEKKISESDEKIIDVLLSGIVAWGYHARPGCLACKITQIMEHGIKDEEKIVAKIDFKDTYDQCLSKIKKEDFRERAKEALNTALGHPEIRSAIKNMLLRLPPEKLDETFKEFKSGEPDKYDNISRLIGEVEEELRRRRGNNNSENIERNPNNGEKGKESGLELKIKGSISIIMFLSALLYVFVYIFFRDELFRNAIASFLVFIPAIWGVLNLLFVYVPLIGDIRRHISLRGYREGDIEKLERLKGALPRPIMPLVKCSIHPEFVKELEYFLRTFGSIFARIKNLRYLKYFWRKETKYLAFWALTTTSVVGGVLIALGTFGFYIIEPIFEVGFVLIFLIPVFLPPIINHFFIRKERRVLLAFILSLGSTGTLVFSIASIVIMIILAVNISINVVIILLFLIIPILGLSAICFIFLSPMIRDFFDLEIKEEEKEKEEKKEHQPPKQKKIPSMEMYLFLLGFFLLGIMSATLYESIYMSFMLHKLPVLGAHLMVLSLSICYLLIIILRRRDIVNAFSIGGIYEGTTGVLAEEALIFCLLGFSLPTILIFLPKPAFYQDMMTLKTLILVTVICGFLSLVHAYIAFSHIKGIEVELRTKVSYEFVTAISLVEEALRGLKMRGLKRGIDCPIIISTLDEATTHHKNSQCLYLLGYGFLSGHIKRKIGYSLPTAVATLLGLLALYEAAPIISLDLFYNITITYTTTVAFILVSTYRAPIKYQKFIRGIEESNDVRKDLANKILLITAIIVVGFFVTSLELSTTDILSTQIYRIGLVLMVLIWPPLVAIANLTEQYLYTKINKTLLQFYYELVATIQKQCRSRTGGKTVNPSNKFP